MNIDNNLPHIKMESTDNTEVIMSVRCKNKPDVAMTTDNKLRHIKMESTEVLISDVNVKIEYNDTVDVEYNLIKIEQEKCDEILPDTSDSFKSFMRINTEVKLKQTLIETEAA